MEENTAEAPAEKKAEKPVKPAPVPRYVAPVATAVVGSGKTDPVHLKAAVYKNRFVKKSLTVHHLQRRLGVLGYDEAFADLDGQYGDLTKSSVEKFQKKNKLPVTGLTDAKTFSAIFKGDPNVTVILD